MSNLRNRGVADVLIAVADGLKGFPDAPIPQSFSFPIVLDAKQNRLSRHIADPERGATPEGRGSGQAVIREKCSERQDRAAFALHSTQRLERFRALHLLFSSSSHYGRDWPQVRRSAAMHAGL